MINFAVGTPGPGLIPKGDIDDAVAEALSSNPDPLIYQYAKIEGTAAWREALAGFLREQGAMHLTADHLCATFGNSLALASIAKTLARPGQCAIVEHPTYFLAGKMFTDAGLRCVRCAVDALGMEVDKLQDWLASTDVKPALVYCVPRHHNPTSVSLDPARHAKLLELAEKHDFTVVYDDPYRLLKFPGAPGALEFCTPHRRLITLASFSKILTPGLRLGWIESTPENIRAVAQDGALNSGGGPANLITEAVRIMIQNCALARHLDGLRQTLSARHDALREAVAKHLPGRVVCRQADGGYFVYLYLMRASSGRGSTALPGGFTTSGLRAFCDETGAGVAFMPASRCCVSQFVGAGEPGFGEVCAAAMCRESCVHACLLACVVLGVCLEWVFAAAGGSRCRARALAACPQQVSGYDGGWGEGGRKRCCHT